MASVARGWWVRSVAPSATALAPSRLATERPAGAATRRELPSFRYVCAHRAARSDQVFSVLILGMMVPALAKFVPTCSTSQAALAAGWVAAVLGALCWSQLAPASYLRWRELVVAVLRISRWALPTTFITMAALLRDDPWRHSSGALAGLLFAPVLLLASGAVQQLHGALGYTLRLPWNTAVLACELALLLPLASRVCSCEAMAEERAKQWLHAAHGSLTWVLLPPSGTAAAAAAAANTTAGAGGTFSPVQALGAAEGECWAVVTMLQLVVGFLVPLVFSAVRECSAFEEFCKQHQGRVQYERWAWLYYHASADEAAARDGWLRWARLGPACYLLLRTVWDTLLVLSSSA